MQQYSGLNEGFWSFEASYTDTISKSYLKGSGVSFPTAGVPSMLLLNAKAQPWGSLITYFSRGVSERLRDNIGRYDKK